METLVEREEKVDLLIDEVKTTQREANVDPRCHRRCRQIDVQHRK